MTALAPYKPYFIEEPTSPDDILGHATIRKALAPHGIGVATGEMGANRMLFKQLLQAGSIDVAQPDACRLGGLNEVLAVLLLCKKYGVPVVPHSGGVGLPEYTVHMSHIDYIVVSGERSMLEFVGSLHEHFVTPVEVKGGYYQAPTGPGFGVRMKEESMQRYEFSGSERSWWRSEEAKQILEGEKI
jgi:L-galactonate dehydratase